MGREKGQAASVIEGLWSCAERNLRLASTRKPVGDDCAPLPGEFVRRLRAARGRERRKNVFRGGPEACYRRTLVLIFSGNRVRTPVSPAAGNLLFGRSAPFVAFAIRGQSLIPNALIA